MKRTNEGDDANQGNQRRPAQQPTQEYDEDDYMSGAFLEAEPVATRHQQRTYSQKRMKDIEAARARGTAKSVKETEVEAREAGLKQNVLSEDNKGFGMLAKMGFKKGMMLGREESSGLSTKLAEPIQVSLKSGRHGLGVDSHLKELEHEQLKLMQFQVKHTEEQFLSSVSKLRDDRKVAGDLVKARRALQQLDETAGLERSELWIPEPQPRKLLTDEYNLEEVRRDVMERRGAYYRDIATDGELADEADDPDGNATGKESAFEALEPYEKLLQVNAKLRSCYFYCLWCGDRYADSEEMDKLCPGPTREHHDDD
ncbi:hypothetical protein BC830DRAFT_459039 [Chytriomyces sp. MP71]|nr:hypothetical protein BC830DRAFT_459039 [Chytriomyces sp. MP71]